MLIENPEVFASQVDDLGRAIDAVLPQQARIAVIAGSGLGGFARAVEPEKIVPFAELPHIGASTVEGHSGALIFGRIGTTPLFLLSGRRHLYEGISPHLATLLLRSLLSRKEVQCVIISNAAGGLNRLFEIGDLMLISDCINWTFRNPLIGPNREDWGPRFPDASELFSKRLRALAREVAGDAGIVLRQGVYLAGHGPSYETRAEVGMLRHVFNADAVGMSTVHETLVARHMGREVLGISFISNLLTEPAKTTHEEVMENAKKVEDKFCRLLTALVPAIG